jgi:hypothetical protein
MVNLWDFINLVSLLVTIMIVWFNSGAFPAYCKLLGLKKFLLGYDIDPNGLTFPQYLYVKSRTVFKCSICKFIIELITCPLCICLWLSIFGACIFLSYVYIPFVYLITLTVYTLLSRLLN